MSAPSCATAPVRPVRSAAVPDVQAAGGRRVRTKHRQCRSAERPRGTGGDPRSAARKKQDAYEYLRHDEERAATSRTGDVAPGRARGTAPRLRRQVPQRRRRSHCRRGPRRPWSGIAARGPRTTTRGPRLRCRQDLAGWPPPRPPAQPREPMEAASRPYTQISGDRAHGGIPLSPARTLSHPAGKQSQKTPIANGAASRTRTSRLVDAVVARARQPATTMPGTAHRAQAPFPGQGRRDEQVAIRDDEQDRRAQAAGQGRSGGAAGKQRARTRSSSRALAAVATPRRLRRSYRRPLRGVKPDASLIESHRPPRPASAGRPA